MNFKFFERKIEKPSPKPELKEGFKPIMVCIVSPESLDSSTREAISLIEKDGQCIDWWGKKPELEENHISNAGEKTYVISDCNDKNKYSKRYQNCTGIIIVGEEKESNRQISIMSHQNPGKFLKEKKENFIEDLTKKVEDIKNKSKNESLDVVIFGGILELTDYFRYKDSISFLNEILTKFNLKPVVMTGPNENYIYGATDVYFDTQNRRLFIIRPAQQNNNLNQSYSPDDVKEQKKKWEKK